LLAAVACGACTPIASRTPADESSLAQSNPNGEGDDLFAYYADARRLEIGDAVPDIALRDTSGRALTLSSFRGTAVVLAFVGASGDDSDNDAEMLRRLAEFSVVAGPTLAQEVHVLTLMLDATESSLAQPARHTAALPAGVPWTFVAARPRDAALLAAAFGVVMWQYADGSFAHTFNTVIIDPAGRLVDQFPGLDAWSPRDLVAAASLAAGI
jgi:peroxiredoxin